MGDGNLAFPAQKLDRPHFTQVHAYGIVRAVDCFLLLFGNGAACSTIAIAILVCLIDGFRLVLGAVAAVLAGFLIFDDTDRSEEHPSELQSLMCISYAVISMH